MGCIEVRELDWSNPSHVAALKLPYDFVLAADCVYHEHIIRHLHRTILDVTHDRSTVLVVNERRSESVQSAFMQLFSETHSIKMVPHSKMDPVHQHPAIEIYVMKKRKQKGKANNGAWQLHNMALPNEIWV